MKLELRLGFSLRLGLRLGLRHLLCKICFAFDLDLKFYLFGKVGGWLELSLAISIYDIIHVNMRSSKHVTSILEICFNTFFHSYLIKILHKGADQGFFLLPNCPNCEPPRVTCWFFLIS